MRKGDNMKELNVAVKELCENLTEAQHEQWEHCKERGSYYGVDKGRKYLKIVSYDDANGGGASVWGFINVGNPNFEVGDVLKAAGWKTPALNAPRGNILKGYDVRHNKMRIYGPDYLI